MPGAGRHDALLEAAGDAALVRRIEAGDETALAAAYDRFAPLVYGLALRVTRSESVAEDIVQEVFTAFWERPHRFDAERGSLRAYLGVLTHRRSVDWVRREEAARRRVERDQRRTVEAMPEVSDALLADDVAVHVRKAVEDLPADQREAVLLAYFGGRTYREVAVILGIPEGTAKSRLRLALAKLGAVLRDQEITPWN
jgi:RNA polymerase sigma-70 factor (ECF subfamily)